MAESTLAADYALLMNETGGFYGAGGDMTLFDADTTALIDGLVQSGIRQFYTPPPINDVIHVWTFLRPITAMVTAAGIDTYQLPDDFGGMDGSMTYDQNQAYAYQMVHIIGEHQIRQLKQNASNTSGRPYCGGIRPKKGVGIQGSRFEIEFFPTPDGVYNLTYRYVALRNKLSLDNPYPLGGAMHSETIIESCLAISELKRDDEKGIHAAQFMERLAASVALDAIVGKADSLGYNSDPTTNREPIRYNRANPVTYNGIAY